MVVAACDEAEAVAKLERPKQEHTMMVAQNEKAQAQITRMLNSMRTETIAVQIEANEKTSSSSEVSSSFRIKLEQTT